MRIQFKIGGQMRCDLVAYSGINLSGKKAAVRIFPTGTIHGTFYTQNLRSMVIRAPFGTRLILACQAGESWESGTWRCIDMIKGFHVPSAKATGLPGVRIPDLDLLNDPSSKRLNTDLQSGFPIVDSIKDGTGWTFGHLAGEKLKGNITQIIIQPGQGQQETKLSALQSLARSVLKVAHEQNADCFDLMVEAAKKSLVKKEERERLDTWLKELSGD